MRVCERVGSNHDKELEGKDLKMNYGVGSMTKLSHDGGIDGIIDEDELGLEKINTIHARSEEYGIKNREKFDIATARAVAPLNILLEYSIPMLKVNGLFVPMKANIFQEILESKGAIAKLELSILEKIVK